MFYYPKILKNSNLYHELIIINDETKEVKNLNEYAKDIDFIIKEVKAQIKLENIDV